MHSLEDTENTHTYTHTHTHTHTNTIISGTIVARLTYLAPTETPGFLADHQ